MNLLNISVTRLVIVLINFLLFQSAYGDSSDKVGQVVTRKFESNILKNTKVKINPIRSTKIYLPPGYERSNQSYPVIYYQHGLFWDNERMFENGVVKDVLDRGINEKLISPFIMVFPDFTNSFEGAMFQNNPVSGRWLEHVEKEVVNFIDTEYRTIKHRDSRALAGDFWGAYGAMKLAMHYPDIFGVVYSMHPIASGIGLIPQRERQVWHTLVQAKSYDDIRGDFLASAFLSIAQAYLPNENKPPFYADFAIEVKEGKYMVHADRVEKISSTIGLDRLLPVYAYNLKKLNAIKIDWGRYDPTTDHVAANQHFARLLDEYGVDHEAEEYSGNPFSAGWGPNGRMVTDVFPFFKRKLKFENNVTDSSM